jgi:hypothetical protein
MKELERDSASVDLFELELIQRAEKEMHELEELFGHEPKIFLEWFELLLADLSSDEAELASREEWERCAKIRDLKLSLQGQADRITGKKSKKK